MSARYLKGRRQRSEMVETKSKEVCVQSKRLERLDEKVSRAMVQCVDTVRYVQ